MPLCSDVACGRAAFAARTPAPARLGRHPGRFQTTCQPSQGERRGGNLVAFLFKRKEEKTHPTTQRTKPVTNTKEFRVALLALCALWRPPCALVAMGTQLRARQPSPTQTSGQTWCQQLLLASVRAMRSPCPYCVLVLLWPRGPGVFGCFCPSHCGPGTLHQGGSLCGPAKGPRLSVEGASVLLSCAPFLASPCVWPLGLAGPIARPCGGSGGFLWACCVGRQTRVVRSGRVGVVWEQAAEWRVPSRAPDPLSYLAVLVSGAGSRAHAGSGTVRGEPNEYPASSLHEIGLPQALGGARRCLGESSQSREGLLTCVWRSEA